MTAPDSTPALAPLSAATTQRVAANVDAIRTRLARTAAQAHRDPAGITLLAVTKSVGPQLAAALVAAGQADFGENRLPGLEAKRAFFEAHGLVARWHYIGHIQRNKARRVVELSDVIHSVDSQRLLEALVRHASELKRRPHLYLQVKIAQEESKFGLAPADLPAAIECARQAQADGHVLLAGLMVMAPLIDDPALRRTAARSVFDITAELAQTWPELNLGLSMGMTGDFEEAVAAGSTLLRIGSALFDGLDPTERGLVE